MYNDITFVRKEEMTSVYNDLTFAEHPEKMYEHFMDTKDDILYFVDGEKLIGVISIGDLERYYQRKAQKVTINQKFSFMESINEKEAEQFFCRSITIREIPVVIEGRFLGVLKREKEVRRSEQQRTTLKEARYGKAEWYQKEIERFCSNTKARLFVYTIDNQAVMRSLKGFKIKESIQKGEKCREEDKKFWGKEYRKGINEEWYQCYREVSVKINNGIGTFKDIQNEFFTF